MSATTAGLLQVALVIVALVAVHRPLGDYMARVYSSERHLRVEKVAYRAVGVDPTRTSAGRSTSAASWRSRSSRSWRCTSSSGSRPSLPQSLGMTRRRTRPAWNTAVSFVTNTNWQSYSGESTMGYLVQMAGLAVQNFISAAVGMAVAIALVRGFARSAHRPARQLLGRPHPRHHPHPAAAGRSSPPWCSIAGGAGPELRQPGDLTTLAGGHADDPGGPVASPGGDQGARAPTAAASTTPTPSHPFENAQAWTNLLEIFLLLVIPFSLPRTFGRMVGSTRQGYAIVAGDGRRCALGARWPDRIAVEVAHAGTALQAAGAAMEGKEVRFGVVASALFARRPPP